VFVIMHSTTNKRRW